MTMAVSCIINEGPLKVTASGKREWRLLMAEGGWCKKARRLAVVVNARHTWMDMCFILGLIHTSHSSLEQSQDCMHKSRIQGLRKHS